MVAAALIALPATAGAATHSATTVRQNPHGRFLGVIPTRRIAALQTDTTSPLQYNGGPVMHSNDLYVIYWQPSGTYIPPSYRSLINTELDDVGTASYSPSNQWSVEEQYYDLSGPGGTKYFLEPNSAFKKSFVDTHAFPANGCTDPVTTKCLTDAQLRAELSSFMSAHGLTHGLDREYFIVTPPNIGSCFDSSSSSCAYTNYCAYHSWTTTNPSTATIYANIPYLGNESSCDAQHYPNGNFGDATLSALSHEFRESITDPLGTGWWDTTTGEEGSDKCAYKFGSWLGSTGATDDPYGFFGTYADSNYNQAINGDKYAIQMEYSNRGLKCLNKNNNTAPTGVAISHGTVTHGSAATFTASGSDPDGIYEYKWYWGDGTTTLSTTASTTHNYSSAGSKSVSLVVFDKVGSQTRKRATVSVG